MEPRFEDLTKEQLIAELNMATEKLKYYHAIEKHASSIIQLSPQELAARLAIAEANLAARQQELVLVYEKNKHLIDRLDQFEEQEKKREFERRLAEATDFLKANGYGVYMLHISTIELAKQTLQQAGYEVRPATEIKQVQPKIKLDAESMPGMILVPKPKRVWMDADMINFAWSMMMNQRNTGKTMISIDDLNEFKKP